MFSCFQGSGYQDDRFGAYIREDVEKVSELVQKKLLLPTTLVNNSHSRDYNSLLPPCWDGLPLLHVAAMQNKQQIFKILIGEDKQQQENYINLNAEITSEKCSGSILHNTLHRNVDIKMIKLLIEHGADCSVKNSRGYSVLSPLLISTRFERYRFSNNSVALVLEELIKHGATANQQELDALYKFIFENIDISKINLLSTCIDKNVFLSNLADGSNLLHSLLSQPVKNNEEFKNSYMELIKKIIDSGIDLNTRNHDGYSILHIALKNETISAEILQLILNKKIDVNCLGPVKETPLHIAAKNKQAKNTDILKLLLEHGANINDVDDLGNNIAHFAANSKTLETLLSSQVINFDLENSSGHTPLLIAARMNNIENVELLLRKGARPWTCVDYEIPNEHILEIISAYASYKQLEAITDETIPTRPSCVVNPNELEKLKDLIKEPEKLAYYFITNKPDLNVVDEHGRGIVHYATVNNSLKIVLNYDSVLIDLPDNNGVTPLMCAAYSKGNPASNQDNVASLLKRGANIFAKDKYGRGIIFYAKYNQKLLTYLNTYINLQNAKHYSFAKSKPPC